MDVESNTTTTTTTTTKRGTKRRRTNNNNNIKTIDGLKKRRYAKTNDDDKQIILNKDDYFMEKGAYILTWHDPKVTALLSNSSYQREFFKKELTISSNSGSATFDFQVVTRRMLERWMKENLMENEPTARARGIRFNDYDAINIIVEGKDMDRDGMGLMETIDGNYSVILPLDSTSYNYNDDIGMLDRYGKYYKFGNDQYDLTIMKREFVLRQDPSVGNETSRRSQFYKLTDAGHAAREDNRANISDAAPRQSNFFDFNSDLLYNIGQVNRLYHGSQVNYWEKVPMIKKELKFYRYTNWHISDDPDWVAQMQGELGKYQFCIDRLPVDTPVLNLFAPADESLEIDPYNPIAFRAATETRLAGMNLGPEELYNQVEDALRDYQWRYGTFHDEVEFTVTFTMEIMEARILEMTIPNQFRPSLLPSSTVTMAEYDKRYIDSQLSVFDKKFWRGAQVPPPIYEGDMFYQIRIEHSHNYDKDFKRMEFCLQLRGIDLNDIVREPEYEEVRWYLKMFLREEDINRLLLLYVPSIIPVVHDKQLRLKF